MDIGKTYERKIEVVEKEIGDKVFFLLWSMTIVQLDLIVWEWINLIHPLNSVLGLSDKIEIKAIELSRPFIQVTTLYTCAFVSKAAFKEKMKKTRYADYVRGDNDPEGPALNAAIYVPTDTEKKLLEFIEEKKAVGI